MRFLLTSSGTVNASIRDALVELGSDEALGLVDFSVFPHLDREDGHPPTPPDEIEAWAAGLSVPAYVIDDHTAIKVVDGIVEVVSEGRWELLTQSWDAS